MKSHLVSVKEVCLNLKKLFDRAAEDYLCMNISLCSVHY